MNRKSSKLLVLLLFCADKWCFAQGVEQPPEVWTQFRQTYPFHAQLVALTRPDASGHRSMILAEPPPHVTLNGVKSVLGPSALATQILKWRIGADGFVKDILVEIAALPQDKVNELVSAISWYEFGTSYKASAVLLPATRPAVRPRVDLSFTMSDLDDHILASHELYSNPENATPSTVEALLVARKTGLFYSVKPGALVWIVPRASDLSQAGKTIRRFALDSDLILGAAANDMCVAIVARERAIPIELLPPLRAETILLLASAEGTQLEQSYERNYVYAGRVGKDLDWAPVYLSPELIDTEYGSLLNVTDQLLKSWSESGKVTYTRFDYPHPAIPFPFPNGLLQDSHANEVTYNWNTSGFGYTLQRARMETFAVNRTGALPVSYINGNNDLLRQKEERGYDWFASTNDPNLARVVQYGALYQIFRRYKITAPRRPVPATLLAIDTPEPDSIAALQKKLNQALEFDAVSKEQRIVTQNPSQAAYIHRQFSEFRAFQAELQRIQTEPGGVQKLAQCLLTSRNSDRCYASSLGLAKALTLSSNQIFRNIVLSESDRIQMMRARAAMNDREVKGWIKTPSIVVSSNPGMQGGHNIRAKVLEFRSDPFLKPGEIRISEENGHSIIMVSEADGAKTSSMMPWLRNVVENGRGATRSEIEAQLARVEVPRRSREVALGLSPVSSKAPRAYESRNTITPQLATGYTMAAPKYEIASPEVANLRKLGPMLVINRKTANDYDVVIASKAIPAAVASRPVEATARDLAGVTELLADSNLGADFGVHLQGVTPDEAELFAKTAQFRIEAETGKKVEINAFVEKEGDLTAKSFAILADAQHDFTHAEISAPEITQVERDGVRGTQFDYRLRFKAIEPAKPSLIVRLRLFFAENVIQPTRQAIELAVGWALVKIQALRGKSLPVNNRLAMLMIKAELRKVCPRETKMHLELRDLYLVQSQPPVQNDSSLSKVG